MTQFLKILPRITALQSVASPLMIRGEYEKSARKAAAQLLDFLNIREKLFHLFPLIFSGGEQQRINIARGIITPKDLLLLDEPTSSLDEDSSNRVLDLLPRLKKRGIAMIGIFHDKRKTERIADKVYTINREI